MRVVAGVDLSRDAICTFGNNFPNADALIGSVRSETILRRCKELMSGTDKLAFRTAIVSGPPCQGFSLAGSRDTNDPRNQIFTAVARAIAFIGPDFALVENVANLLSEKYADRLGKFERILTEADYSVTNVLLNACDYGVPQRRRRAFFLVSRRPINRDELLSRLDRARLPMVTVGAAFNGLPAPPVRSDKLEDSQSVGGIYNHFAMRHSQRVMDKIANLTPGSGPMSYRKLNPSRPSNTLFSGHRAPPAHFIEPRSITVREAARLQGFPDSFRVYGSFANQMGLVSNAVPPPLTKVVLKILQELVTPQ